MPTAIKSGLDQNTIDLVKATVPILQERGAEITKRFYKRMFENNPELKNIFNQTNQRKGDQSKALADTVYAAAAHIDQLEAILPAVMPIAHKHRSLNIKPEHYPIVGENLLAAMREVLTEEVATDEIIEAWEKAYGEIANVFISIEKDMYNDLLNTTGGWVDFRDFKVVKKQQESSVITSFYLEPADGKTIPTFEPGQYTTVKVQIEGQPYTHQRQYTLSCAPSNEQYRISVKREDAIDENPAGVVSTFLHNHVEEGDILPISAPSGDFVLDKTKRPLVLISGGVGLTPMMSMLEETIKQQPNREVIFIHAARSGGVHAMKDRLQEISAEHKNVSMYIAYNEPSTEDEGKFHHHGYVNETLLNSSLPGKDAACYFCGPKPFMRAMHKNLIDYGMKPEDIRFEIFGPAEDITA